MTPDEIRALRATSLTIGSAHYLEHEAYGIFMREIAAQLAEQNALNREALAARKAEDENMKVFREQSLAQVGSMRDVITAPPNLTPVFRMVKPSETPEHIGCFVLLPDGSYAMAITGENGPGIVPLELEEAQRLIAILSKPPEGKPQ